MADDDPQIVERDGDVVRIVAGDIELIASFGRSGDDVVLDRASIDGPGPGAIGLRRLRELARRFIAAQNARRLIVRGTVRTTGAQPGKMPRDVIFTL